MNQLKHPLLNVLVLNTLKILKDGAYLRHNWLAVITFNISERHLGAFVLIDLQFRVIDVFNPVKRYLVLYDDPGYTNCCVSGHLYRP